MKALAIDGGGVKGIIPARILQEIETRTGKPVAELFDIVTGTSTGGLLALGLTASFDKCYNIVVSPDHQTNKPLYSAKDLVRFYLCRSKEIFAKPTLVRKFKTGFGVWGSKYDRTAYDAILDQVFGNSLLGDTICPVFIPIYSLENNKPFIASTFFAAKNLKNEFYLKDIAAATSAAPTYFDPKVFRATWGRGASYQGVDGSIYADNPELIGIIGVYIMHPRLDIKDITLVSLGTGNATIRNNQSSSNNGEIGWLKNKDIIGDMMDAESSIAETAIKAMLNNNTHFRLQPDIPSELDEIDNSSDSNLQALLKIAEDFISNNSNSIDKLCKILTEERKYY